MPSPSVPYLSARHLGLTFPDGREIFAGLDLSFATERTGLVGANGVGKSVLLDVLTGAVAPTSGAVTWRGVVAYVPQRGVRTTPSPCATVGDLLGVRARLEARARVLAGVAADGDLERVGTDGWDLPERLAAALARVGLAHIPLHRPADQVSGGEATRLALAAALLQEPDLLILDEPTNDLDRGSREALHDTLGQWRGGLLVVSHDRALLRRMDRIVEMTDRGVRSYAGGYDAYRQARDREVGAALDEMAAAEAARRKVVQEAREVRERQARRAARGKKARQDGGVPKVLLNTMRSRSQRSTGHVGRVMDTAEREAAERVSAARIRVADQATLRMDVAPSHVPAGKDILALEDVGYTPPDAPTALFDGVRLVLRGPERVAITGPNGSGKSTLMRIALGDLTPTRGSVRLGVAPPSVAWLDQSVGVLRRDASVLSCFRAAHPGWDEAYARHRLARYLFEGDRALAPVEQLSGGERMRAGLACVLGGAEAPALLVLDEPTNHLDFRSLEVVEAAVASFDGALLVASHDDDFLRAVGVEQRLSLG